MAEKTIENDDFDFQKTLREKYFEGYRKNNEWNFNIFRKPSLEVQLYRVTPYKLHLLIAFGNTITFDQITKDMWECLYKIDPRFLATRVAFL